MLLGIEKEKVFSLSLSLSHSLSFSFSSLSTILIDLFNNRWICLLLLFVFENHINYKERKTID